MDQPIPLQRQVGEGNQRLKRAITAPKRHPRPNCKQASLLTKTSWNSGWSTSTRRWRSDLSQRSAPQKRHMAHLRRHTSCTPRKPSSWDEEGDKTQPPSGGDCVHQAPGHLSCSDLGRAQNAGPTKSVPLWRT